MTVNDSQSKSVLGSIMKERSFTGQTRFYRSTYQDHLTIDDDSGDVSITANPDPSEAVDDLYAGGYISLAAHMGPGLAFTETRDHEWLDEERVAVSVLLQDVIDQGGLIYPVESVTTDQVWYFTLPEGRRRAVSKAAAYVLQNPTS